MKDSLDGDAAFLATIIERNKRESITLLSNLFFAALIWLVTAFFVLLPEKRYLTTVLLAIFGLAALILCIWLCRLYAATHLFQTKQHPLIEAVRQHESAYVRMVWITEMETPLLKATVVRYKDLRSRLYSFIITRSELERVKHLFGTNFKDALVRDELSRRV